MKALDYITEEVAECTKYKSVFDEYNRDRYSIVLMDNDVFYIESRGVSDRTYKLVIKETKRLFPSLTYIGDLPRVALR